LRLRRAIDGCEDAAMPRWQLPALTCGAFVVLAACGTTEPVRNAPLHAPPPLPEPAPTVNVPPAPSAAPVEPRGPIEPIAAESVACDASPESVTLRDVDSHLRLCDANLQRCFLEAVEVPLVADNLAAKIAKGPSPRVLLEARYEGMLLRGFIATPMQYAQRPLVFGGFFIPETIDVKEGRERRVLAAARVEEWVKPIQPVELELACDDVSFERSFHAAGDVVKLTKAAGEGDLVSVGETELFDAKGVAVATISPSSTQPVHAHQIAGKRRLIVMDLAGGTLFGWVSKDAIVSRPVGHGSGMGIGRGGLRMSPQPESGLRCDHDLAVLALIGSARLEIGTIPAKLWFTPAGDIDAEHRAIQLRHPFFGKGESITSLPLWRIAPGVKLAVLRSAIAGCERR
jgi:hypothetical protein